MIKRFIIVVIVSFILIFDVFSQNTASNQQLLQSVQQQFKAKQYDEVIETANKALFDKNATKDSCFFMMYDFKAVSYYNKHQEDSAVSILIKGIELYEELGKKDEVLVELYRSYLDIACPSYREGFSYEAVPYRYGSREYNVDRYMEYSINLLKHGSRIYSKDFERYGRGFLDRIRRSKWNNSQNNGISNTIEKEKNLVKDILVRPFDTYFKLLQTEVTGETSQYLKVAKEFESFIGDHRDELIEKWIDICYNEIVYYYYSGGHIEAVAEYFKNYIGFLKSKNPDYIINKKEGNSLNENVLRHIAYLQSAMQFDEVKSYCKEVISNKNFVDIKKDESFVTVSYDYDSTAYLNLVHGSDIVLSIYENPSKRIDPKYFRYIEEIYPHAYGGDIDYNMPYLFSTPIYKVGDIFLKMFDDSNDKETIKYIHHYLDKELKDIEFYSYNSDSLKKNTKREDYLVLLGQEYWDADMLGFDVWLPCHLLSLAYDRIDDLDNAIKWQKIVSDIVSNSFDISLDMYNTDTVGQDSFGDYLDMYNLDRDNIGVDHINFDFYNNMKLAYMYKKAKQYDKSYEYYEKYTRFYLQVVNHLFKGSDIYKEQVWNMHEGKIEDIVKEIIFDCVDYPPFGDLVLELSALQKGFLAWQKIALKDAVDESNNKTIRSIYDRKINIEKDIEMSYYITLEQKGRAELFGGLADCEDKIKSQIGSNNILDRTILKTEDIKQSLSTNDVYVDFIEVPIDTIEDVAFIVDGRNINIQYIGKYLYAIIMRKQWEHPKIISLGKNTDYYPMEWLSYSFNDNVKKDEQEQMAIINEIYLDTVLSHYIWDKIIMHGEIREGDNIYYIPDGYLHRIAIESLSFDDKKRVSDIYNCYRMSSARELLRKKSKVSKTDKCLGIGGLQYSKSRPLAIDGQQKKKDSKKTPFFAFNFYRKRNTAPSSMFSRDFLEPLFGSQAELAYLSESFGESVTILNGTIGTENYVLHSINRIKPSILHIGTHGFNCINKNLSTEEERFLIGDRDGYVSPMENSLYRTGLYMSLPQFESSKTASDGIITAKEISMTDLSNTKLVVLSACSTALGNVNSEGVYGLQRCLKLAGAESMLVSLWDVNDKSTELLMKEFYKQLSMGKTRREALQNAQEAVRNYDEDLDDSDIGDYKTFEAPYYWAGFVLIDGNE